MVRVGGSCFQKIEARSWRVVVAALALTALAACAGVAPLPLEPAAPPPPSTVEPPAAMSEPAVPSLAARPPPAEPVPTAAAPSDAARLVGVAGDRLLDWLGETMFVRRDGVAEIWRFAADNCYLDVFLYRGSDGLKIAHVDARPRTGTQRVAAQTCYGRILAGRPKTAS